MLVFQINIYFCTQEEFNLMAQLWFTNQKVSGLIPSPTSLFVTTPN